MTEYILALGFFDGVHLGHAALLRHAAATAKTMGLRSAAVSFSSHPSELLAGRSVPLLSNTAERELLISRWGGVDETLFLPFDRAMRETAWDRFLTELTEKLHVRGYVAGHDFRFGLHGDGTAALLQSWCGERGLYCAVIPPVTLSDTVVSSTHIRALAASGELEEAVRFLGHPYLLCGTAENGVVLWGERRLPLPPGRYAADLTLSDGRVFRDMTVECRGSGVLLPFPSLCGELSVAFTRRADKEESSCRN